ncbi:isocitrate lyase/phosphoenolpyruvate mutase family protein [Nocardioides sp.]|uniref:isocitrate lyase/PEP mutase family protein n=1 Tax=Nocardioides sp. TaxID=35761 RepID=UPI002735C389|nr:isocitrate lyase/phosphoenolpyruvate mutase family protein [Nocardioides sp.]MDP3890287.1 isocitrate lyase/phosphoenolpyruvate mutase family protein [Nocardioides sp.]
MSDLDGAALFHDLHQRPGRPLVLANCWDVVTARLVEEAGAAALATTSAAVAWSLGRPDGHRLELDLMLATLRRITTAVDVPVSCDIEGGFGEDDAALAAAVRGVIEAGAVGVNLEDSTGSGPLRSIDEAAHRVRVVRDAARKAGVDLFINARTDTYLSGSGDLDETVLRGRAFVEAGASGVFVPGTGDLDVIGTLVEAVPAPLNVLVGPGSPTVPELDGALTHAELNALQRPPG